MPTHLLKSSKRNFQFEMLRFIVLPAAKKIIFPLIRYYISFSPQTKDGKTYTIASNIWFIRYYCYLIGKPNTHKELLYMAHMCTINLQFKNEQFHYFYIWDYLFDSALSPIPLNEIMHALPIDLMT